MITETATQGALIIGASSGIGRAIARRLAKAGYSLILAGRDLELLRELAADIEVRFQVKVECRYFEALEFDSHTPFFRDCVEFFSGNLHGVMLCHGQMPEQTDAAGDFALTRRMIDVNYLSSTSILNLAAGHFEDRKRGWVAAVTSVAGDRGRASNYLYGSTKAALSTVLAGLRVRLAKVGVTVTDIKPGFVDTSLTWARPGMFLVATPATVANDAYNAIKKNKAIVYTPFFWSPIMMIIRLIPDFLFRRMSL